MGYRDNRVKKAHFTMWMEPQMHQQLRREAETRGLTMSEIVRWALRLFFDHGVVKRSHIVVGDKEV
jgi:hypothetical protein